MSGRCVKLCGGGAGGRIRWGDPGLALPSLGGLMISRSGSWLQGVFVDTEQRKKCRTSGGELRRPINLLCIQDAVMSYLQLVANVNAALNA